MLLRITVILVVKKDAAEAARLAAVLDEEVVVRPLLELGVVLRVVLVADLLVGAVEVLHVLLVEVGRRDVRAAAEPPDASVGLEVAIVEVHGGGEGVSRVHHGAQAAREEWNALSRLHALRPVHAALRGSGQGLLRHRAVHDAEVAPGLLEDFALAQHSADAAAAVLPHPGVLLERRLSVHLRNGLADIVLRLATQLLEALAHAALLVSALDQRGRRLGDGLVRVPAQAHLHGALAGEARPESLGAHRGKEKRSQDSAHHVGHKKRGKRS
mmetsp:Transcript_4442/g.17489  ORF Transcript_4442/g.17489 Transcript_4442/m.17489 type:complete len:270 (-) Transcript_4442:7-816(-)